MRSRVWSGVRRIMSGCAFVALLALASCGGNSGPDAPAHTFTSKTYHFALHIAAGWVMVEQHEDPSANTPFTFILERAHVPAGATNSTLNFSVVKADSTDYAPFLSDLAQNPQYQSIQINGHQAYVTPPQIFVTTQPQGTPGATIPTPQTPVAGAPGTLTHIDYALVTSNYAYIWYTEAVAGDNADHDLDGMSQSLTILP